MYTNKHNLSWPFDFAERRADTKPGGHLEKWWSKILIKLLYKVAWICHCVNIYCCHNIHRIQCMIETSFGSDCLHWNVKLSSSFLLLWKLTRDFPLQTRKVPPWDLLYLGHKSHKLLCLGQNLLCLGQNLLWLGPPLTGTQVTQTSLPGTKPSPNGTLRLSSFFICQELLHQCPQLLRQARWKSIYICKLSKRCSLSHDLEITFSHPRTC